MTSPLEALRTAIGREHDVPLADLSAWGKGGRPPVGGLLRRPRAAAALRHASITVALRVTAEHGIPLPEVLPATGHAQAFVAQGGGGEEGVPT